MKLVVSFGGGVNSLAILVGLRERGERPDVIVFGDPGAEKPETYAMLDKVDEWCGSVGFPRIVRVKNDGISPTLEEDCLKNKTLPPIVMGWKTCSQKYKQRPIHKYLKAAGFFDEPLEMAIGFDAGEAHRLGDFDTEKIKNRYLLVEWGWDRKACVAAIQRAGLPVPIKSACFFCPSSKPHEILWLKREHPDLLARALAMEQNTEGLMVKGLGRTWSWSSLIKADEDQYKLFDTPVDIGCICFDGDGEAAPAAQEASDE